MTCIKQTSSKYTSRPGPPYSARACAGKTKRGNDGRTYVSKLVGKFYKWVLTTKSVNVSMNKLINKFKKETKLSSATKKRLLNERLKRKKSAKNTKWYPYYALRSVGKNNTYTFKHKDSVWSSDGFFLGMQK